MTLNYNQFVSQIANLIVVSSNDANFQTMLPGMIDYGEQRIYRELDPLRVQITDSATSLSSGNRNFTVPNSSISALPGSYIIVDNINVITPSSMTAATGSRVQLTPTSREFIDIAYPSGQNATGVPEFFAMASDTQVILGPAPDLPYPVEIIGVQRPAPLSASNSSTFLTQYVPDLFIAGCMVFASGYMRDFGQQADNPQMGASWESQYNKLFASAQVEQLRAKFQSQGWTSDSPSPIATPQRV